ncbi:MAG: YegP family protein [Dehalococcoidia bacterium]
MVEFCWRLIASNRQMIGDSGEGYESKDSAKNGYRVCEEECGLSNY